MQLASLIKNAVVGGGTLIALAATVGVNPAEAATFSISATDTGWYNSAGSHDPTNQNYLTIRLTVSFV
jgi:Spy/CpxP family protein refolding chaperone